MNIGKLEAKVQFIGAKIKNETATTKFRNKSVLLQIMTTFKLQEKASFIIVQMLQTNKSSYQSRV